MRLSVLICLLIVVLCISVSETKKKKDNKQTRKSKSKLTGKGNQNKGNFNQQGKWDDFDVKKKKKTDTNKKEKVKVTDNKKSKKISYDYNDDEKDDSRSGDGEENEDDSLTLLTSEEFNGETRPQMQRKGVYYSVESIKKYFRSRNFRGVEEVYDMLKRHNESEFLVEQNMARNFDKAMLPFYVVEGVNPATRKKVAQILAHRLKGLWIENQPRITLGPVLASEESKKAYYSFSKYMIANKIKLSLFNKPVVTESYWTEHSSYIMAKVFEKADQLPNPNSEVYKFPEDLLVPNVTFVVLNSPLPRLGKGPSKSYLFEQRMLLIYKRFTGAKIYIIRFPESPRLIADKIDLYFHGEQGFKTYTNKNYFNIEVLH